MRELWLWEFNVAHEHLLVKIFRFHTMSIVSFGREEKLKKKKLNQHVCHIAKAKKSLIYIYEPTLKLIRLKKLHKCESTPSNWFLKNRFFRETWSGQVTHINLVYSFEEMQVNEPLKMDSSQKCSNK